VNGRKRMLKGERLTGVYVPPQPTEPLRSSSARQEGPSVRNERKSSKGLSKKEGVRDSRQQPDSQSTIGVGVRHKGKKKAH